MQMFPRTVIIRHRKENLKKCSLHGLERRPDFCFYSYPMNSLPVVPHYILLTIEAPSLKREDAPSGLLLLDATWRYAEKMQKQYEEIPGLIQRSIPSHFRTAYPRYQEGCIDPERGLASIEAIFLAYWILGRNVDGLLDFYYWKNAFLEKNGLQTYG
jgi:pre-rRNA-processing protein TSR3